MAAQLAVADREPAAYHDAAYKPVTRAYEPETVARPEMKPGTAGNKENKA